MLPEVRLVFEVPLVPLTSVFYKRSDLPTSVGEERHDCRRLAPHDPCKAYQLVLMGYPIVNLDASQTFPPSPEHSLVEPPTKFQGPPGPRASQSGLSVDSGLSIDEDTRSRSRDLAQ